MRKIFIKNYKSIHDEIFIDISSKLNKKLMSLIGRNGVGKSNILSAISWLFSNGIDEKNVTTKFGSTKSSTIAEVTLIQTPVEKSISKIIEILKRNSNSWNLSNENFEILNSTFVIINKKADNISKFLTRSYIDKDGQKYESLLYTSINILLKKGKELLANAGNDISNLIKVDEKGKYVWYNNELYNECETIIKNGRSNLPISIEKFNILTGIKLDIEKIINTIQETIQFNVNYVKNADLENKTETTYLLSELISKEKKISAAKITDFLNFYFPFSKRLEAISENQQNKELSEKNADYELKIAELIEELNEKAQTSINKLFYNFDIYAQPRFRFQNNLLLVSVENKESFEIYDPETENNSSGYKAFFEFILMLSSVIYNANNNPQITYILMADEPDKNLHIYLQRQLIFFILKQLEKTENVLVIFTTHSPFLIPIEKSLIYSVNKSINFEKEKNLFSKTGSTYLKEVDFMNFINLNKAEISLANIAPVLEAINYSNLEKEAFKNILEFSRSILNNNKILYKAYDEEKHSNEINSRLGSFIEFAKDDGFQIKNQSDYYDNKEDLNKLLTFAEIKNINVEEIKNKSINDLYLLLKENFKTNILILAE